MAPGFSPVLVIHLTFYRRLTTPALLREWFEALAIGFGVLVGPADEAHFRMVPGLRVVVLGEGARDRT